METLFEKQIENTLYKVRETKHYMLPPGVYSYVVQEYVKCKSDNNWVKLTKYPRYGLDARSAKEALEYYLDCSFEDDNI